MLAFIWYYILKFRLFYPYIVIPIIPTFNFTIYSTAIHIWYSLSLYSSVYIWSSHSSFIGVPPYRALSIYSNSIHTWIWVPHIVTVHDQVIGASPYVDMGSLYGAWVPYIGHAFHIRGRAMARHHFGRRATQPQSFGRRAMERQLSFHG